MSEFKEPAALKSEETDRETLRAYVTPGGNSLWIEQDTGEVSIYSRKQAIALRDWLTRAIGEAG